MHLWKWKMHEGFLNIENLALNRIVCFWVFFINWKIQIMLFSITAAVNDLQTSRLTRRCCLRAISRKSGKSAHETGKVPLQTASRLQSYQQIDQGRLNHVWSNVLIFHPLQLRKLWERVCLRSVGFVQAHSIELWSSLQLPKALQFCVINPHILLSPPHPS